MPYCLSALPADQLPHYVAGSRQESAGFPYDVETALACRLRPVLAVNDLVLMGSSTYQQQAVQRCKMGQQSNSISDFFG